MTLAYLTKPANRDSFLLRVENEHVEHDKLDLYTVHTRAALARFFYGWAQWEAVRLAGYRVAGLVNSLLPTHLFDKMVDGLNLNTRSLAMTNTTPFSILSQQEDAITEAAAIMQPLNALLGDPDALSTYNELLLMLQERITRIQQTNSTLHKLVPQERNRNVSKLDKTTRR